jgi:hypothetical protein
MEKSLEFDEERIDQLRKEFDRSLAACRQIFSEEEIFSDISKERNRQGVVYYDLLMNSLGEISMSTLKKHREEIREAFANLCKSAEFKKLIAGGVQRKTSIARRNKLWNDRLEAAIK